MENKRKGSTFRRHMFAAAFILLPICVFLARIQTTREHVASKLDLPSVGQPQPEQTPASMQPEVVMTSVLSMTVPTVTADSETNDPLTPASMQPEVVMTSVLSMTVPTVTADSETNDPLVRHLLQPREEKTEFVAKVVASCNDDAPDFDATAPLAPVDDSSPVSSHASEQLPLATSPTATLSLLEAAVSPVAVPAVNHLASFIYALELLAFAVGAANVLCVFCIAAVTFVTKSPLSQAADVGAKCIAAEPPHATGTASASRARQPVRASTEQVNDDQPASVIAVASPVTKPSGVDSPAFPGFPSFVCEASPLPELQSGDAHEEGHDRGDSWGSTNTPADSTGSCSSVHLSRDPGQPDTDCTSKPVPMQYDASKTKQARSFRRMSVDDVPQVSDVDIMSPDSAALGRGLDAGSGAAVMDAIEAAAEDPAQLTPTWPPAYNPIPLLVEPDKRITVEALSIAESLAGSASKGSPTASGYGMYSGGVEQVEYEAAGDDTLSGGPVQGPIGDPWSAFAGRPSTPEFFAERIPEPGRAYAAVAAAAQKYFNDAILHGRSAYVASQEGNLSSMQASLGSMQEAVHGMKILQLAPHAHTSWTRACKALAFAVKTPVATPVAWAESHDASSNSAASWASIGSRVVTGGIDGQQPPAPAGHMVAGALGAAGSEVVYGGSNTSGSADDTVGDEVDSLTPLATSRLTRSHDIFTPPSLDNATPSASSGPSSTKDSYDIRRVWTRLSMDSGAHLDGQGAAPIEWVLKGSVGTIERLTLLLSSACTTVRDQAQELAALRMQLEQTAGGEI